MVGRRREGGNYTDHKELKEEKEGLVECCWSFQFYYFLLLLDGGFGNVTAVGVRRYLLGWGNFSPSFVVSLPGAFFLVFENESESDVYCW